jgi:large subunit ribosomal protein L25
MATATAEKTLWKPAASGGGKNDARRVRQSGKIPAVVYGAGQGFFARKPSIRGRSRRILRSETGHNTIFDLASMAASAPR